MNSKGYSNISCALLVSSCDAYSDLWLPFFNLFWKYWPDCPFPVYLTSNHQKFTHQKVMPLCVDGDHSNWSQRLYVALSRLDTEYVLLVLEDFFFQRRVVTKDIIVCLEVLKELDGNMLRLVNRPKPDMPLNDFPYIGNIQPGAPYRVSTQAALWRRKTLMGLLINGESIWQFELQGSRRSDNIDKFYSVWKTIMPYGYHVVERGKWFRHEAARFRKMNIGCDFSSRPIMKWTETLKWAFTMMRGRVLQFIPWPQRIYFVRFIRKLTGR
jgi:hypothetical protein